MRHVTGERIDGWLYRVCQPVQVNGKWIYDYTVTVDLLEDPNWAIIKGFYYPKAPGDDFDLVFARINKDTGRLVKYERQHRPGVWIVQKDPKLTKGKIIMKPAKKIHPEGLPHLSDATSSEEILAGSAAWAAAMSDKKYKFIVAEEHAIDETTDVMLVVRKKLT